MYRKFILPLLFIALSMGLHAQNPDSTFTLRGYGFYDTHVATGSNGGGALMLDWHVSHSFTLGVGAEYASCNRISGRLSGQATLFTAAKGGRLILENGYLWRHFPELDIQEFTGSLQLGWQAGHIDTKLGLCNRYIAALVQRENGGQGTVMEPMNVMFAAEGWWNNRLADQQWNIGLRWSNYNDFIIERVANWSFSIKGLYRLQHSTFFTAEVGIHPVGALNLTSSYDGWFMHLGAQRKF